MADEAPETPSPDTAAGPPSTPASPPAGEAPAAADSTTPPPAPAAPAPPSIGAKIGQILHDQGEDAKESAPRALPNLAAGAVQGVEGLVNFTEAVAKHIPLVGQTAAEGLEAVKQNVLPTPEQVTQVYGKPANWMDNMVRGIGNFTTLDALTGGIGGEAKLGAEAGVGIASKVGVLAAKATINTAKNATIMTLGSDPRTADFISTHAKDAPGAMGRFFNTLLAIRPNDPLMLAYARSEARNFIAAAGFETAIFGATALAVVRQGGGEAVINAAKAAHSSLPEPVDAAGMEKLPDGQVKVTDAPPPGSLAETMLPGKPKDLRPLGEKLDNPEGVEDQSRTYEAPPNSGPAPKPPGTDWTGEERRGPARNAFLTDEEAQLARMPAPEAHPDVVMPTEGAANVEVAARNETRSQEDLAQSGPEKYEAGFREIQTAMSQGVHQAVIQQIVRDHDIQVPYGLDGGRLQNYLTKLGELMKSPPNATKPDAQLAREASSLLDPTATPEEMGQRFKDWFQTGDNSDSKIVAAHLYLRTLGSQAAKLGEALDAAPMSPTAQNNIDKMWDTMMQIYVPMRGEGTRSGRVLRAFGIMKGTIKNALGMGDKEALADAAMDQKATGFGAEGPAPREAAGPQATEQLAATQSAGKLPPEAREQFARSLRIANGDPAELLEATRQSMIRGELDMKSDVFRAATKAANMTPGEKAWNAYSTYMINNMISGVGTVEKVAMSQAFMTLKFPTVSFLGGTGRVIGGAVRADLDEVKGGAALATQGLNQFMGLATESWSALKAGARAMRAGKSTIDPMMDLFPGGKPTPEFTDLGMGNFLYYPITAPSRLHSSMTEFTKTLVYRSYVRSQALREIAGRNLSPDEISDHVSKALTNAFDPEGKAIQGAQDGALYEARRATMTQPLDNVLMGKDLHNLLAKHPVTRLYMAPFQKIGTNGFKESWSMFPGLAGFQNNVRQQINAGGDAAAKAYANMTLGASFLATAFYQAAKGNLTGIGPTNPDLRKQRAALGVHPYTLTLGGVRLNLDRMPLVGPIMAEGADMEQGLENVHARVEARRQWAEDAGENKHVYLANHPIMEALRQAADYVDATRGTLSEDGNAGLEALVASFSKKALDPTWMSGMTKVMDLMTSGDSHEVGASFHQWISEQLQTAVPWSKFWQSVNNDTIHRETRSVIDELKAKAPGFSKTLEPDYDGFGNVQENTPGFIDWLPNSHVNPMRGVDMKKEAMDTELLAFGQALPGFPKSTAGVDGLPSLDWTDRAKWDQDKGSNGVSPYARVHELLASPMFNGKTSQEVIEEVMGSEAYEKLPQSNPLNTNGPRFKTIAQIMDQLNEAAKAKMLAEPRYANFAKHVLGNQVVKEVGKAAADNTAHHAYQRIMQSTGQAPADDTTQTPSFTYIYHGRRK